MPNYRIPLCAILIFCCTLCSAQALRQHSLSFSRDFGLSEYPVMSGKFSVLITNPDVFGPPYLSESHKFVQRGSLSNAVGFHYSFATTPEGKHFGFFAGLSWNRGQDVSSLYYSPRTPMSSNSRTISYTRHARLNTSNGFMGVQHQFGTETINWTNGLGLGLSIPILRYRAVTEDEDFFVSQFNEEFSYKQELLFSPYAILQSKITVLPKSWLGFFVAAHGELRSINPGNFPEEDGSDRFEDKLDRLPELNRADFFSLGFQLGLEYRFLK